MPAQIHPTAVVDPKARLSDAAEIGPYCIIGPEVEIGSGTRLHSHVVVDGCTTIGEDCQIFPFACLGKQTQDLKFSGGTTRVRIGNRTTVREYATIHQPTIDGAETVVGSDCNLLAHSHVAHDCILGDGVIMSNSVNLAGHVIVEDGAVLGGMSGIHQFVKIGALAMVSATAKVVQDVIPYGLVDGNPAALISINRIGMQRRGIDEPAIEAVGKAFRILFRSNLRLEQAAEKVLEELGDVAEVKQMLDFIDKSERGLARPRS